MNLVISKDFLLLKIDTTNFKMISSVHTVIIIYFPNYGPCIKKIQIGYVKEDLQI